MTSAVSLIIGLEGRVVRVRLLIKWGDVDQSERQGGGPSGVHSMMLHHKSSPSPPSPSPSPLSPPPCSLMFWE